MCVELIFCVLSSFFCVLSVLSQISHVIPVLYSQKKTEKIKKNDFWGQCSGLNCVKIDPKKLKKKYTVAHSILEKKINFFFGEGENFSENMFENFHLHQPGMIGHKGSYIVPAVMKIKY